MSFYRKPLSSRPQPSGLPKKLSKLKQILSWRGLRSLAICGVVIGVIGVFVFTLFAAWVSRDLPNPDILTTRTVAQSTKIFDRSETHLLYEIHGDENRTLVKIQNIALDAQHATIAIEDKDFYQHHGVYWKGLIRAVVQSVLKGQRIQGTSTLTQQLVKNAILDNRRSSVRKLKEFILSLQIERQYSKDQILQLYFNEIPYGSTIYGIESASQTYFGKSAKDLSLDEASLLAAIPQAPDLYSPYGTGTRGDNRARLVVRQHYILDLMEAQGYATHEQVVAAKATDTLKKIKPRKIGNISAPHFVMYVRSLLIDTYGTQTVEQGGLRVITTLDWDKQLAAEEAVKKGVETNGKRYGFSNAALISLEPKTGQIMAMVGSKDFFDVENDGQVNVTLRPRQPGSSFKPIVYAAGFIKGFLPQTQLWDVATVFKTDGQDYRPQNYDGKEHGLVSVRTALQGSLNIPAVKMMYLVGLGRVLDLAESLGYTTLQDRSRFGLSLVLGGGEVKPIEHASAYGAFANDGVLVSTSAILKVQDSVGKTQEEWKQPEGKRVFDVQVARLTSDVLSDNAARTYVFGSKNSLTLPDRPVAAKTGTTNNYHDAWTMGYTPSLVAGVWVGNNDNAEMKRGADGSVIAAPIWQSYMRAATKATPVQQFTPPEVAATGTSPALLGLMSQRLIKIDKISGKRATEYTPLDQIEELPFYEAHSILYYLDKDNPSGPAPTNPASDPQFTNWETAVQSWAQRAGWHTTSTAPTQYDDIHTPQNKPVVTVYSPAVNQTISSAVVNIDLTVAAPLQLSGYAVTIANQPTRLTNSASNRLTIEIPNSIPNGFQDLTVTASDIYGNRGEATISINLNRDTSQATTAPTHVRIMTPAQETTWSRTAFPQETTVTLENPSQYRELTLSFLGDDGEKRLVNRITLDGASVIRIPIPLAPPAGRYALIIGAYYTGETAPAEEARTYITISE